MQTKTRKCHANLQSQPMPHRLSEREELWYPVLLLPINILLMSLLACWLLLALSMERDITTPPAPATPCTKRHNTNCDMSREKIQPTVEIRNRPIAANKGERRPYLSLNGPKTNCPIASPTILVVSPNCTLEVGMAFSGFCLHWAFFWLSEVYVLRSLCQLDKGKI